MIDTRPPAARTDFSDLSAVDKYVMPAAEYESRTDSVLAWKKAQKLGRFDPNAPTIEQQKILASEREVEERGKLFILPRNSVHYDIIRPCERDNRNMLWQQICDIPGTVEINTISPSAGMNRRLAHASELPGRGLLQTYGLRYTLMHEARV